MAQVFDTREQPTSPGRRAVLTGAVGLLTSSVLGCTATEDRMAAADTGPFVPVHALMTTSAGAPRGPTVSGLTAARDAGAVADVDLLGVKSDARGASPYETFAVLEFREEAAFRAWLKTAGGLGQGVSIKAAEILIDDRPRVHSKAPVYVIDHYEAMLPVEDYLVYAQAYIGPNMRAQKAGGILAGYAVYWEREPTGPHHRAVLVKEYFNEEAFSRVDVIRAGNEPELLKNPEWRRIHAVKARYRTDISETRAAPITLT